MPQWQAGLPVVKANRLAQQQPGHHLAQEYEMTLVAGRAVLTEESDQLSMELGTGCHRDLDWFPSPTLSWQPAHPMRWDPFCCSGSRTCVSQPGGIL